MYPSNFFYPALLACGASSFLLSLFQCLILFSHPQVKAKSQVSLVSSVPVLLSNFFFLLHPSSLPWSLDYHPSIWIVWSTTLSQSLMCGYPPAIGNSTRKKFGFAAPSDSAAKLRFFLGDDGEMACIWLAHFLSCVLLFLVDCKGSGWRPLCSLLARHVKKNLLACCKTSEGFSEGNGLVWMMELGGRKNFFQQSLAVILLHKESLDSQAVSGSQRIDELLQRSCLFGFKCEITVHLLCRQCVKIIMAHVCKSQMSFVTSWLLTLILMLVCKSKCWNCY